jgi:hypothetical protein
VAGQWVSPPSCCCDSHSQPCLLLLHEDDCFRAATYRHCFVSSSPSPSLLLKSPSAHFMLFEFIPQLFCRYLTAVGKRRGIQCFKWISMFVRDRSVGRSVGRSQSITNVDCDRVMYFPFVASSRSLLNPSPTSAHFTYQFYV